MGNPRRTMPGTTAETITASHAARGEPADPGDQQWLTLFAEQKPGSRLRLRLHDEQDVAGHMAVEDPRVVRLLVGDEELDTEAHAISIRLPSIAEADALRRRLLLTGVLVGTVVLGTPGVALAVGQADDAPPSPQVASQIEYSDEEPAPITAPERPDGTIENVSYEDATPNDAAV